MAWLTALVTVLRNFLAPLPHLPTKILRPLVPYLSWYVFLRGLVQVITGLRDISWGLRYRTLPYILATLINVPPWLYVLAGALSIAVGVLYFKAFAPLADERRRASGWQAWATAAAALTLVKLYNVILIHHSVLWFTLTFLVGWYLIFQFERVINPKTTANHQRSSRRHPKQKPRSPKLPKTQV
ncbi:MAG: hypothetical protein UY13_C0002G0225 [Candidatus Pacebacteria bacterium GW2011_GWB1_47_8]|nr:MAG: hypothetical protein UX28_C0001G0373 [Candidatus Pacebacteria bacterium GW2011_GWA1_46_10]KKU84313.1 MAG: hypothetical protein UY13_C0002G0225 [Candidatus Pacebacteria bacterium GW2011_GWB1_47_8]HCR81261.1 hypothetical protein [Candidatus Paceibacterota bacterium]